jgi:hypothetical protein
MLTLHYCHVKDDNGWSALDDTDVSINDLYLGYKRIRIYVTTTDKPNALRTIDLDKIFGTISPTNYNLSLSAWVATASESLLTQVNSGVLLNEVGAMRRKDLWDYPVNVSMGNSLYGEGSTVPKGLTVDLVVSPKTNSDIWVIDKLANKCLMSINGRVVKTERSGDRLFVKNARNHLTNETQIVSVLEFEELGNITTLDVRDLTSRNLGTNYPASGKVSSRVLLTTPFSLTDKTVMAVVDGYPHFLDGSVEVRDANTVIIKLYHNSVCKRMLLDNTLNGGPYSGSTVRNTGIHIVGLDILDYLNNTNSFLVIIDNDDVNRHTTKAGRTDIIGMYTTYYPPQGILVAEDGRLLEYAVEGTDGDQTAINTTINIRNNFIHDKGKIGDLTVATNTKELSPKPKAMDATFVDIYTTVPA